jgi:large subunit ribosomal protein L15
MGFEGGQMPLTRRLPKRGFFRIGKTVYEVVNLSRLNGFDANAEITPEILKQKGIIRGKSKLKILSHGELSKPLVIKAHSFSKKALEKIAGAGGRTEKIA